MKPSTELNQSAEFDKSSRHILKAKDVVLALSELKEPTEYGVVSDAEYIYWVYTVLTSHDGFGKSAYGHGIEALEGVVNSEEGEFDTVLIGKVNEVIQAMKTAYTANAYETANELNTFLNKHPNLFLRSENEDETINEIQVLSYTSGQLEPSIRVMRDDEMRQYPARLFRDSIYIDINQLSDEHHQLVTKVLSL